MISDVCFGMFFLSWPCAFTHGLSTLRMISSPWAVETVFPSRMCLAIFNMKSGGKTMSASRKNRMSCLAACAPMLRAAPGP